MYLNSHYCPLPPHAHLAVSSVTQRAYDAAIWMAEITRRAGRTDEVRRQREEEEVFNKTLDVDSSGILSAPHRSRPSSDVCGPVKGQAGHY